MAVPDGWSVIRGFNFIVDAGTDMCGWQYASSFFSSEERTGVAFPSMGGTSDSSHNSLINSVGTTKRGQTEWTNDFDEACQFVRRRLWCRIMCPLQYKEKALAACSRYLKRQQREEILVASDVYVELDSCCSSSYKQQRVALKDNSIEFYTGQKRTGVFPLSQTCRVRLQDSRIADHKAHPLLMRVEDAGDQHRDPDYISLAMKREGDRILW